MKKSLLKKQKEFVCIYCGTRSNPSKEHYLPRSLGTFKNYEPLLNKVCVDCNGDFKILEDQFIHSSPEALFREMLGVKGRKHHSKKAIFYERSAGTDPLIMIGKHPGEDYEILWELNPGTFTARELRQILLKNKGGKVHQIPVPKTMKEPADFKKAIKELKLENCTLFKVIADKHEQKDIEHLLSEFIPSNTKIMWLNPETDRVNIQVEVKSIVTDKYFRAIAKIGFHYLLKQLPKFTGVEPEFDSIRNFIRNGKGEIGEFVKIDSRQIISDFARGYRPKNYMHVLSIDKNHRIIAKVQFYVGLRNLSAVWKVNIGMNPLNIFFAEGITHSFMYFDSKTRGFDGEMLEVMTARYILNLLGNGFN